MLDKSKDKILHKFLCLLLIFVVSLGQTLFATSKAYAEETSSEGDGLYTNYGGWMALGGTLTFAGAATAATYAIEAIREPPPGIDCAVDPDACKLDTWGFIWTMLTLAGAAGLTFLGAWGTGMLARKLEARTDVGWALAGTFAAMPMGALIGFSVPEFAPRWGYYSMVAAIMAGTMAAGGVYLHWVASKRGHAWPEFAFGILTALGGATLGTLICGRRPCLATFVLGAIGGLAGFGLSTLITGFPDKDSNRQIRRRRTRSALTAGPSPMISYGVAF